MPGLRWRLARWLAWVGLSWAAAAGEPATDRLIDFQRYRFGLAPAEFEYDATGPHGPVVSAGRPLWRAYADLFAPSPKVVLIQSSGLAQTNHYPIALVRDWQAEDCRLAVSFKVLSGSLARSAGILWRAQDKDNYFVVLAGGLDHQFRLLRLIGGCPEELAKAKATFDDREWNDMEISCTGESMTAWLNNRLVLEAALSGTPGAKPGRVGLITQADTIVLFDDFYIQSGPGRVVRRIRPPPEQPPAPSMRVSDLFMTEADFKTPRLAFRSGEPVRWQVRLTDQNEKPVAGAVVCCELVGSSGESLGQDKAMTGSDGRAFLSHMLPTNAATGTYTLQVRSVTHADKPEASYKPDRNVKSRARFEVRQ